MIFTIEQDPTRLSCPCCGSRWVSLKGQRWRQIRSLPIGRKPVWITLGIRRVFCLASEVVRQAKIGFADARRTYTKAFERYALELGRRMTIQDMAWHLVVSWDLVKDIQRRDLEKRFARPRLKGLKRIAIDEISIGKRHRYITVVLDRKTGAVVFVGEGKGSEALTLFWKRLKCAKAQIEAVVIDMSPAYISAVTLYLNQAAIVFDHFHFIKLFNDKLSDFRHSLYRQARVQD